MARRIAMSQLNARTVDILNTIRANAGYEYQSLVPEIASEHDIPKVGEVVYGNPALSNQFLNALINRIAAVVVRSATFNNPYAPLKKGYLEFGETIEELFVDLTRVQEFSVEKAAARELKRSLPNVKSAFHTMNWRVQYPVTIQDEDLKTAFLSAEGVQGLIAKIVNAVYTSAEYDEYLLFKYLLIKAVAHGKVKTVGVDASDPDNFAIAFRSYSNNLMFVKDKYNGAGVHTSTPREDQYIFMDTDFNARFDVKVLASAFNMDKADYIGHQLLIDGFHEFDNTRFAEIAANSDMIEPVTVEELEIMKNVKAILVDKEFFQVYDNNNKFTETYVSSGMYWNYFYNTWKTVSYSPFSNIVAFVDGQEPTAPADVQFKIDSVDKGDKSIIYTFSPAASDAALTPSNYRFIQTQDCVEKLIAVHPYGAFIVPATGVANFQPACEIAGNTYIGSQVTVATAVAGEVLILAKQATTAANAKQTPKTNIKPSTK